MLIVNPHLPPRGWSNRFKESWLNQYILDEGKASSQPISVFLHDVTRDVGQGKAPGEKWQCTAGHFAGDSCRIAPVRDSKNASLRDCEKFMREYHDKRSINELLGKCSTLEKKEMFVV